jgi:hypothetical protein
MVRILSDTLGNYSVVTPPTAVKEKENTLLLTEKQLWRTTYLYRIGWFLITLQGIQAHGQRAQACPAKSHQLENSAAADAALLPGSDNLLARLNLRGLLAHKRAKSLFQVHRSWRRATVMA